MESKEEFDRALASLSFIPPTDIRSAASLLPEPSSAVVRDLFLVAWGPDVSPRTYLANGESAASIAVVCVVRAASEAGCSVPRNAILLSVHAAEALAGILGTPRTVSVPSGANALLDFCFPNRPDIVRKYVGILLEDGASSVGLPKQLLLDNGSGMVGVLKRLVEDGVAEASGESGGPGRDAQRPRT